MDRTGQIKYFKNNSWTLPSGSSWVYKSIYHLMPILSIHTCKMVGSGLSTSFWFHTWFPQVPLAYFPTEVDVSLIDNARVADFITQEIKGWDFSKLDFLPTYYRQPISESQLDFSSQDTTHWQLPRNGEYALKSASLFSHSEILFNSSAFSILELSKLAWVHRRVIHFFWRLLQTRIPMKTQLCKTGTNVEYNCIRCKLWR